MSLEELSRKIEQIGQCTENLRQLNIALGRPNCDLGKLQHDINEEEQRANALIRQITVDLKQKCQTVKSNAAESRHLDRIMKSFKAVFATHQTMSRTVLQRLRTELDKRADQPYTVDEPRVVVANTRTSGVAPSTRSSGGIIAGGVRSSLGGGGRRTGDSSRGDSRGGGEGEELGAPLLQQHAVIASSWDVEMQQEQLADLRALERDLDALGTLFTDVAILVEQQQGQLNDIESNIEETGQRVSVAVEHLDKAKQHQKSARKKMCFLLCCLLILAAVVVGIIGGVTKGFTGGF